MKKKSLPVTNIGTTSLMMVFIILCMVTFAALSLSSVMRDARFGQKIQAHSDDYYTASNEAETILAQADRIFADAFTDASDEKEFYRMVEEQTQAFATADRSDGQFVLSYRVNLNDTQALSVRLAVHSPNQIKQKEADSFYKILSWQVIHTDTWEGDNTLKLIQ